MDHQVIPGRIQESSRNRRLVQSPEERSSEFTWQSIRKVSIEIVNKEKSRKKIKKDVFSIDSPFTKT